MRYALSNWAGVNSRLRARVWIWASLRPKGDETLPAPKAFAEQSFTGQGLGEGDTDLEIPAPLQFIGVLKDM